MQTILSTKSIEANFVKGHISIQHFELEGMDRYNPVKLLRLWHMRSKQRLELEHLPQHLLDDLGITSAQRDVEVEKHFWQP